MLTRLEHAIDDRLVSLSLFVRISSSTRFHFANEVPAFSVSILFQTRIRSFQSMVAHATSKAFPTLLVTIFSPSPCSSTSMIENQLSCNATVNLAYNDSHLSAFNTRSVAKCSHLT